MISVEVDSLATAAWQLGIVAAILLSFATIWKLAQPNGRWSDALRARFIRGIPWGTFTVLTVVLVFYLVVQDGLRNWHQPVMIAFTASSYLYPLGTVTAGIAHSSPSHLTNNITSALVLAPLAEYVWSHYPVDESADPDRWYNNPYVRAFGIFPVGVLLVAMGTGMFSWGPVIGFSGVVFALAGFSLVKYPIVTVVALVARSAFRTLMASLTDPIVIAEATASFSRPSWAGIAVQSHALGLLLGIVLGAIVGWRRLDRTDPFRLWIGTVLAAMSLSLWAIWWVRGSETYVLYRGLGVIAVLAFAILVTTARVTPDRPVWRSVSYRQTAILVLCIPLVTMSLLAIPLNLNAVTADPPNPSIEVGDYTVYYDRDVPDGMLSVIDVSFLDETTSVTTNGVIVVSEERHIWRRAISTAELAFHGDRTVVLGGVGWRETVDVERRGWETVGDDTVYHVWFTHDGERTLAYESEAKRVEPVIEQHHIYLRSVDGEFTIEVYGPATVDRVPVPDNESSVAAGGLTIRNDGGKLVAVTEDGTTVRFATRETYPGRS